MLFPFYASSFSYFTSLITPEEEHFALIKMYVLNVAGKIFILYQVKSLKNCQNCFLFNLNHQSTWLLSTVSSHFSKNLFTSAGYSIHNIFFLTQCIFPSLGIVKRDKAPLIGIKNPRCFGFLFVSYGDISTNFKTAKKHLSIPIYVI